MIVISRALALALAGDEAANSPLIGWRNIVTLANLAADTEDADYPAVNLANPSTALKWVADDTTDQYLTITTGEVDPIDYIAVARHNFGTAQIPVSVEGRASAEDSYAELVEETLLADDAPVLFRFAAQSLYQVRLKLQPDAVAPSAAVVYCGKLLVLPRRIYVGHTPITYGRRTQVTNGRSESGNFLGRIVTGQTTETAVPLQNLNPAWYRASMEPFVKAAQEAPFFFAWRPSTYPLEVGYAWVTNDPVPVNQRSNGMMQIDLQLGGIAA